MQALSLAGNQIGQIYSVLSASNWGLTRKRTKGQQFWKNSPSNQLLCQCKCFSWCHRGISAVNPGSAALGAEPSTRAALLAEGCGSRSDIARLQCTRCASQEHTSVLCLKAALEEAAARRAGQLPAGPWEAEREPCAFLHFPLLPSLWLSADSGSPALARHCLSRYPSVRIINNLFKTLEIFPGRRLALPAL